MLEAVCKPWFNSIFLSPLVSTLARCGIKKPNVITGTGCLLGVMVVPSLAYGYKFLAVMLILLSGIMDVLDGAIARKVNCTSSAGAIYDIVGDRVVEFAIILGLFLIAPEQRALDSILMLGSILLCVTSFLVVGIVDEAESEKSFYYSPGLMERPEAFIFFIAMILMPQAYAVLAKLFTGLVLYTAAYRVWEYRSA